MDGAKKICRHVSINLVIPLLQVIRKAKNRGMSSDDRRDISHKFVQYKAGIFSQRIKVLNKIKLQ
jgi:hypothetical protein